MPDPGDFDFDEDLACTRCGTTGRWTVGWIQFTIDDDSPVTMCPDCVVDDWAETLPDTPPAG